MGKLVTTAMAAAFAILAYGSLLDAARAQGEMQKPPRSKPPVPPSCYRLSAETACRARLDCRWQSFGSSLGRRDAACWGRRAPLWEKRPAEAGLIVGGISLAKARATARPRCVRRLRL
jgi:hypothetical protein